MSKTWITSDHHFGHARIIELCKRPFVDVDEMNFMMALEWNRVVGDDDTVFHLGDFTLGGVALAQTWFSRLKGHIMVLSNPWHHDKRWIGKQGIVSQSGYEVEMLPPMVVLEKPEVVVMCHYPILEWDRKHYGSIHLHGHSHGTQLPRSNVTDVGVDCTGFAPILLDDAIRKASEAWLAL